MDNFLIIRLSSLGDIIHTLPAFSALRKKFSDARISWVVEEKGKEILDFVPGIDKTIVARTQGRPIYTRKFWREISRIKKEMRGGDQLALDFQGLLKSGLLAFLSGAEKRIGFHRKNLREPLAAWFYTDKLEEMPENIHVIDKNLKLLNMVGIRESRYEFPLVIPDELVKSVKERLSRAGYNEDKKLVVYNVGAAWITKRWFADRWAELIEMMKRQDLFSLLLWGSEEEKALAEEVHEKTGAPISPVFSLKEVVALVKQASLLVSGDTFALQAACAFSRPVVGIFGPTNPRRNGPFRAQDKVAFHEIECSYCYRRACGNPECLKKITPEEVAELCVQVLDKNE
ncbi:MAG: glycosyltransferase family 9 protein [Candidatus Aminicenantes bacterium]|nr:glycosyltransferase family 9 protein [Candidatus Aminicenantes bacterium]